MKPFGAAGAEARRRGAWSWIFSALLAAVLLWWALRGVEWQRVAGIIGRADWVLAAAAAATCCFSLFLRGLRWRMLLNAAGGSPWEPCSGPIARATWQQPASRPRR